jgi:DNA repair protein RadC
MEAIREMNFMERPREKLRYNGANTLSDAELLAILLGTGIKGLPVIALSESLLAELNYELTKLPDMNIEGLCKFKGIGEAKAVGLLASLELAKRCSHPDKLTHRVSKEELAKLIYSMVDREGGFYVLVLLNHFGAVLATANLFRRQEGFPEINYLMDLAMEAGAKGIILSRIKSDQEDKAIGERECEYGNELKIAARILDIVFEGLLFLNKDGLTEF